MSAPTIFCDNRRMTVTVYLGVEMNTDEIIEMALKEDRYDEDLTTNALIPEGARARGVLYAKESGVIVGLEVARDVFCYGGSNVFFRPLVQDGDSVRSGQKIAEVEGDARVILSRERVALNFLQHLSGIATTTHRYVVKAGKTKILDTRKTTPGLRKLEKYAVRMGGGYNHRLNLAQMILIKDNHIALVGSIMEAVKRARANSDKMIEVETKTIEQVKEAVRVKPDRIMLDNMPLSEMKKAVKIIRSSSSTIEIEASGGVTMEAIPKITELGLDYVSCGALTHSVKALDISLELE